jgi:hypothetical protein
MAGSRTGTPTIIKLVRKICRLVTVLGAGNLSSSTSVEYAAAVFALVAVCAAFEAADNFPAQIDRVDPAGPEDVGFG